MKAVLAGLAIPILIAISLVAIATVAFMALKGTQPNDRPAIIYALAALAGALRRKGQTNTSTPNEAHRSCITTDTATVSATGDSARGEEPQHGFTRQPRI